MELVGRILLYVIMACCLAGGIAYAINDESGLAQAFQNGINTMANMFIPICGLMAAVPLLKTGVEKFFGPVFSLFGGNPVIAAAMIVPPDCSSYALSIQMANSPDIHATVIAVGFMCASTIAFNIPIGLSVLDKKDYKYLALGSMSGFLSVPFGIFTTCAVIALTHPLLRTTFSTVSIPTYAAALQFGTIFRNLIPIIFICILLALGLKFFPNKMVKGFMIFGKALTAVMTLIVVISIVQHYTGFFGKIFGSWPFDPLIGDAKEPFRAIELLGTIAMMLAGAFPMVYLVRKYFSRPLEKLGSLVGLKETGSAGLVACLANGLAIFPFVRDMKPKDKVVTLAFLACAGYSLGDFIAFDVNFQPNLVVAVFVGQIVGGLVGIFFAKILAVPRVEADA